MYRTLALFSASLLLLASSASADYIEIPDAPDAPPGQETAGGSPMLLISGSLNELSDFADVYRIVITSPMDFMAEVVAASFDSTLALFDSLGNAIGFNDDQALGNRNAKLVGTDLPGLTTPGTYLLGVADFGLTPQDASNVDVFQTCASNLTCLPNGAAGPLNAYNGIPKAFDSNPGVYTIKLSGSVAPTPEPSAALLFGLSLGVAGLAVRRPRQARQQSLA